MWAFYANFKLFTLILQGRFNVALYNKLKWNKTAVHAVQRHQAENRQEKGTMTRLSGKDITNCTYRQRRPTVLSNRNCDHVLSMTRKTEASRKKETLKWCSMIHGKSHKAISNGLWTTLVNFVSKDELRSYMFNSSKAKKVMKSKTPVVRTDDGMSTFVYSMKVLYQGGLISKRKYQAIRNSQKSLTGISLLPYKTLRGKINSLDSCRVESLDDINGCCRDLEELLTTLANMYFSVEKELNSKILHFYDTSPGVIHFSMAADGAPFGKQDCATALLVAFINLKHNISSCDHHFLMIGANCKEDDPNFLRHCKAIYQQARDIEEKEFIIDGKEIKFKLSLVPADMKWVATACGELTNSATYPTTFANVRQGEMDAIEGSVGDFPHARWHEWTYEERLQVTERVKNLKKREPKIARPKVTKFIASCGSRNEFDPIIGRYVEDVLIEPLHVKNNAFQQLNEILFSDVIARTPKNIISAAVSISSLPEDCALASYMHALLHKVKAGCLHAKLCRWFRDDRKQLKGYKVRFTGEESLKFARNFMYLIDAVSTEQDTEINQFKLHQYAYCFLQLRDVVHLMSRFYIERNDVLHLREACRLYFNCCALFFPCTLTTWCIGKIVALHTNKVYGKFGLGLGLNTAQGREAKHLRLKEYTHHSTWRNRWVSAFQHEEMHLIWLRNADPKGFGTPMTKKDHVTRECKKHLPNVGDGNCICGLVKAINKPVCKFCTHPLRALIHTSCLCGSVYGDLKKFKKK